MNSSIELTPRSWRMWLRTAASMSTARLRPAATGMTTRRTGTPRTSSDMSASGSRPPGLRPPAGGPSRGATSLRFIFGRTPVPPKLVGMSTAAGAANRRSTKPRSVPASKTPMTWMLFGWVRLRWPISEAAAAASRRTTDAPSRPATHASDSASRLSSCSFATSTCSIRPPCGYQLVQRGRVGRPAHRLAQRLVAEHLRELREHLQVLLGRLLRHEQHEHEAHGIAVWRVEGHRLGEAHEGAQRILQALDAPGRDGDALAEPGRAEPLAREQAVEDDAFRDAVPVLEQQDGLLEQALLARHLQVGDYVALRKELGDQAHRRARIIARSSGRRRLAVLEGVVGLAVQLVLVADHLAVELVGEEVDRRVQVGFLALAVQLLAGDVRGAFGLLPELLHREDHVRVEHMVEMPRHALELGAHVAADRRGHFDMVAAHV